MIYFSPSKQDSVESFAILMTLNIQNCSITFCQTELKRSSPSKLLDSVVIYFLSREDRNYLRDLILKSHLLEDRPTVPRCHPSPPALKRVSSWPTAILTLFQFCNLELVDFVNVTQWVHLEKLSVSAVTHRRLV